jgi:diguanylate cyclase (GGDEF)-like protein
VALTQSGPGDSFRRALRVFAGIVLPAGIFWSGIGLLLGGVSLALVGFVAAVLGAWLLLEVRGAAHRTDAQLAMRIAVGTEVAAVCAVTAEPVIGVSIALGSLIPVVLALPYVGRSSLTRLMAVSAGVGVFSLVAPMALPWGSRFEVTLLAFLPTSTLVIVYVLFELFLWNASSRLTDTTTELRHVIEMAHDLAASLDQQDVGNRIARHIALVAGADDCVLSTWDRTGDRVVTFGAYPPEHLGTLQPAYDLTAFPATRTVLETRQKCAIDVDALDADPAEVGYLRSLGQRSLVMLPLVVAGESIGIVELASAKRRAFSERQVVLAELLAREAAVTFDNARLYDELRQLAYRDPLTGLDNRARLQDRVEHALERIRGRSPHHAAVLFIDLDDFKHVNDRFGHAKGDHVLEVIADRVRAAVRPGDTAARLGGDEFAILLEDVDGSEVASVVSQRLLESLAEPVDIGDAAPIVGASIGIAVSGPGTETGDDLLRHADIAMYAAKAAGRSQVVTFRKDLLESASARSELAAMLRGAEARNELQLHFQPVVNLDGGRPIGVEALVRWQPRGHLLHMPAEFIGLAEETGEILPIGRWVVGEACRRVRGWQTRFNVPSLRLYVNLSARQFRDPGLVSLIASSLARTGLEPGSLTLEITESTLLTPGFETVERIGELRALGARLAIDDFGTGYSSLGYLRAFQIDELKIDRSFVPDGSGVGEAHVLSQAIVELGRALTLNIVAEGIETEDQADWFRRLGCRLGQGFLYARPMAAADLERYLRRQVSAARAAARAAETADALGARGAEDGPRVRPGAGITDVMGVRKAG